MFRTVCANQWACQAILLLTPARSQTHQKYRFEFEKRVRAYAIRFSMPVNSSRGGVAVCVATNANTYGDVFHCGCLNCSRCSHLSDWHTVVYAHTHTLATYARTETDTATICLLRKGACACHVSEGSAVSSEIQYVRNVSRTFGKCSLPSTSCWLCYTHSNVRSSNRMPHDARLWVLVCLDVFVE